MKNSKELNEPILSDDYPIYGDYLYIVDGNIYKSDWHDKFSIQLLKFYKNK